MNELLEARISASAPDRVSYRPEIFRMHRADDRSRLEDLLKRQGSGIEVHDRIVVQLEELVRSLHPSRTFSASELREAALAQPKDVPLHQYGVWVHYPWSNRLVHLLDGPEFQLVRTDRNRNKITLAEQQVLASKKIGIIGLSVGQSVALTIALERGAGEIRLADHDLLELSNLNRIRSGVHELGGNKVINAAREIAELDPFLQVTCFTEGITKENIAAFFSTGGDLDLLIEECDSVDIKIIARQEARSKGIPVVMDTSDRGLVDVERYDLEPDRPLLHGLLDDLDISTVSDLRTNQEKLPFMARIVGIETISDRMKASLPELGRTILTWPQLASGVVLGGALVCDVSRRILLGEKLSSGRWWVDIEKSISASTATYELPVTIGNHTDQP